ncbi:MAG: hypothetical protein HPY90_12105 [Syntrophothermus sp.]|uniref:hypothetical protein n=1 Tax=Syntrophothermus sp. TaxID=2736299 RepID=UPI00257E07B8|nr:hypothetical protein [Syntrophothermus sp.]NSW83992.1 hypothetical protein [Syntrophothermus sp.]
MGTLEFLISSALFFFLTFASVDYFITLAQYQIAEHITAYYLERIRVEGRLTSADETEMISKFNSMQMTVESISCPRESQGSPVVRRNPVDPNANKITVTITLKPAKRPFLIGQLIGGSAAPDTFRIRTGGTVLSEKV